MFNFSLGLKVREKTKHRSRVVVFWRLVNEKT